MQICDYSKCTACGACRDACPKGCISFAKNEYGMETVTVDDSACIGCERCSAVCQAVDPVEKVLPKKTYAVCLKDLDIRKKSASGGAAYALYRRIIEEGGVVYGAAFDDSFRVVFKKTSCIDELESFQGSKYTYSDMKGIYKDILNELRSNKVLFIGTSCQCAGIKKYIPDLLQQNLYLVDIICHGMPPAAYWEEYKGDVGIKNSDIKGISFRDNNVYRLRIESKDGVIVDERAVNNPFMANYTRMVFYRENCYSCEYACPERVTDITIGDYWGWDRQKMLKPNAYGMSAVLVNTEKGTALLESCKDDLVITLKNYTDIVQGNEQLRYPSIKPYYRQIFLDQYKKDGFNSAAGFVQRKIIEDAKKKEIKEIPKKVKRFLNGKYHYITDVNHRGRFAREHFRNKIERSRLVNKDFSLLTNNCIGGVISHDLGLPFRSPTINLLIKPDDFVKFLENFDYYKSLEIKEIICDLDYPVGMLGDIPLFFKHYDTFDEAVKKWNERMTRINYDNIFVMMTDRFCCSYDSLERFEKLPFKHKVCFTAKNYPEFPHCVQVKKHSDKASVYIITNVMNYFGKRLYQYAKDFDYIKFLNGETNY